MIEDLVGDQDYLAGGSLSLADLFLAPIITYFSLTPEGDAVLADMPRLRRWFDAMDARAAMVKTAPPLLG